MERQELFCHECNGYVQFDIDIELNGNHVITCPNCGHEHCRVVENGIITSDRWDSRNSRTTVNFGNYTVNSTWYTTNSTFTTYTNNNTTNITKIDHTLTYFTYQSWLNTGQNGTNSSSNWVFISSSAV